jgi:hypothetical protein
MFAAGFLSTLPSYSADSGYEYAPWGRARDTASRLSAGARWIRNAVSSSSLSLRLSKSAVGPDPFDATTDVAYQ